MSPKTDAEVIAKLQRQGENRAKHLLGLIDSNARLRYEIHDLEETLAWIWRKLTNDPAWEPTPTQRRDMAAVIERRISRRIKTERLVKEIKDAREAEAPRP